MSHSTVGTNSRRGSLARWGVAIVCVVVEAWGALYWLGRTWGSTKQERGRPLLGDERVPQPAIVTDHAIDIGAPPEAIWPWLVQVGWHRAGWYTHRWVDRLLFPANAPSAETLLTEFQQLTVGDVVPDGPPEAGCFFTVERLEPHRALVLVSHTHLPPPLLHRPGASLDFSWAFLLEPLADRRTRFHFRSRAAVRPWWLLLVYRLLLVPADFVMARSMCRGLKRRAEQPAGLARGRSAR